MGTRFTMVRGEMMNRGQAPSISVRRAMEMLTISVAPHAHAGCDEPRAPVGLKLAFSPRLHDPSPMDAVDDDVSQAMDISRESSAQFDSFCSFNENAWEEIPLITQDSQDEVLVDVTPSRYERDPSSNYSMAEPMEQQASLTVESTLR